MITPVFEARRWTRIGSVAGGGGGPARRAPRTRRICSAVRGLFTPSCFVLLVVPPPLIQVPRTRGRLRGKRQGSQRPYTAELCAFPWETCGHRDAQCTVGSHPPSLVAAVPRAPYAHRRAPPIRPKV